MTEGGQVPDRIRWARPANTRPRHMHAVPFNRLAGLGFGSALGAICGLAHSVLKRPSAPCPPCPHLHADRARKTPTSAAAQPSSTAGSPTAAMTGPTSSPWPPSSRKPTYDMTMPLRLGSRPYCCFSSTAKWD